MRYFLIAIFIGLQACAKIPVMSLEAAIRDAAIAAKAATQGATETASITVNVTNATEYGGDLPIPVVPLNFKNKHAALTQIQLDVDLNKFNEESAVSLQKDGSMKNDIFLLDTRTGNLYKP